MNKSEKSAAFVLLTLVVAVGAGLALYFSYAATSAVPFLAGCVLVAAALIAATAYLVVKLHQSKRNAERYAVPPNKVLNLLSRRQWLSLMTGLTVIAITIASLTGVKVLASPATPVASTGTPTPSPAPPTPSPTDSPTPTPSPTPTDSLDPSQSSDPSPDDSLDPSTDPSDLPTPAGAITYLDSVRPLAGSYNTSPATFSGTRYPRGIYLTCESVTNTYVQWNVAGNVKFSAVAGIDDVTSDAFGKTIEMIFYDQDGRQLTKPIDSSQGHPQHVAIDLKGVVGLRMTCAARFTKSNQQTWVYASLGDPQIVHG